MTYNYNFHLSGHFSKRLKNTFQFQKKTLDLSIVRTKYIYTGDDNLPDLRLPRSLELIPR